MPSTHSATITFFATYIAIASWYLPIHAMLPAYARLVPVVTIPWAMTIVMSRIWLGYHTWPQVVVGCAYGGFLAVMWFVLWTRGRIQEVGHGIERDVWKLCGWS
jgi:dolichyldiphosphatase